VTLSVSAIILAAGESTRMGAKKALLEWEGVPLIAYHLQQLGQIDAVRENIVVVGHEPERVRAIASSHPRTIVIDNPDYRRSKASSVLAGLRAMSGDVDAILVAAVDQPRSARVLRRIIDAHAASGASITVPAHSGRRGHPTIFDRTLLPELLAISDETEGLRAVVRSRAAEIHEVECDASVLVDLNEPADIQRARETR
jgi:molybdenum cofactor cytidylyltransferase